MEDRGDRARSYWLLAGALFIGGGIGAIPPDLLHEPQHPPTIYLLPLLAISLAAIWLIEQLLLTRIPPLSRWLGLTPASG